MKRILPLVILTALSVSGCGLIKLPWEKSTQEKNREKAEQLAESAEEKMQRAEREGNPELHQEAMQDAMRAVSSSFGGMFGGSGDRSADERASEPPASADTLAGLTPEELAGLARARFSQKTEPMFGTSEINATFEGQGASIRYTLTHHRMMGQAIAMMPVERNEDSHTVIHNRRDDKYGGFLEESYARDGSNASLRLTTPNGVQLHLSGQNINQKELHAALNELPLARLKKL